MWNLFFNCIEQYKCLIEGAVKHFPLFLTVAFHKYWNQATYLAVCS